MAIIEFVDRDESARGSDWDKAAAADAAPAEEAAKPAKKSKKKAAA